MTLQAPTTSSISTAIIADLELALSQSIPLLPKSFTRVLAKVLGGAVVIVYRYAGFMFLQMFVAFASNKSTAVNGVTFTPLAMWGNLIGVGEPAPAVQAELKISVTVLTQGGSLPSGLQVVRADTGVVYVTKAGTMLDASVVTATVVASSSPGGGDGSGSIGNLEPGDVVSFAGAPATIVRDALVSSVSVSGADAEATEDYRARIVSKFQARPQGGAYADYRDWALGVTGIVAAYPYTSSSPGEVDVYVEATEASSGSPDGIPLPAQLTAVADAIELDLAGKATRRPVTAAVNVYAIARSGFDVVVAGLVADDIADLEASIEQGLDEHMRTRESFIVGLSVLPRLDRLTQAGVAGITDGIVNAAGGTVGAITLSDAGTPLVSYSMGQGERAKLASITFI